MRAAPGHEAREVEARGRKAQPQKVRCLAEMALGVAVAPVTGLGNISASQFELTWESRY